jgi:transposase
VSNKNKIICKQCNCPITSNNIKKHENICKGKPSWFVRKSNNLKIYYELSKRKNLEEIDWDQVQKYYDDNHSYREVQKTFDFSSQFLANAIKEGKLKTRTGSQTARLRGKFDNLKLSKSQKENISKGISKAISEGRIKYRSDGHRLYKIYHHISWLGNEEILHAGWELKVAKYMDEQKIHWCKSKDHFTYIFENQEHEYFPDFYLKEYDLFIEVKGRLMPKDSEKWKQFPKKLLIIDGKTIKKLNEFFSSFTTKIPCNL